MKRTTVQGLKKNFFSLEIAGVNGEGTVHFKNDISKAHPLTKIAIWGYFEEISRLTKEGGVPQNHLWMTPRKFRE